MRGNALTDYVIKVSDSGTTGNDSLVVAGSAADDVFLLRSGFVAGLQFESGRLSSKVERVQYDSTLEGLTVSGMAGNDRIYSDDTSIATTIEGGAGADSIQIGQLYGGTVPGVTDSSWFAASVGAKVGATTTTLTTRGYLSNGNSVALAVRGGDGDDITTVYGNRAALDIQGQAGDDITIVRALVVPPATKTAAASYVMHAPITVDADAAGADGNDRVQLVGTELADDLLLVADRVQGMGVNLGYGRSDQLVVDGQERDDRFFVTASAASLTARFIGGLGADTLSVGGDVTGRIVSYTNWNSGAAQPVLNTANILTSHQLDAVAGSVFFDGGVAVASVTSAQLFAGEKAVALTQPVVPATTESAQLDLLRVYDDGNTSGRTGDKAGRMNAEGLSGLGLGGTVGVSNSVEVFEVLMGSGNDGFTVSATATGTITVINGGGGSDTLTATGGGGAAAPLILLGDSLQDGGRYTATASTRNGAGLEFASSGNDRIDASGASGAVVIYGGAGNDTLIGSRYDDQIAGGSGNDSISAGDGNDHVYGDSGFNLDLSKPLVLSTQPLLVVNVSTAKALSSDALVVGNDTLSGGSGKDILIGDHGTISQAATANRLLTTGKVTGVTSVVKDTGGSNVFTDTVTDGESWIFAGIGADTITGSKARQFVIADAGSVTADASGRVLTIQSSGTVGGNDSVTLGSGAGVVIGGAGADSITTGSGTFQVIGDHGSLTYDRLGKLTDAKTVVAATGSADVIRLGVGGSANVVVLGGEGADQISTGNGVGVIVGDHGAGKWKSGVLQSLASTNDTVGGNDTMYLGGGDKVVIGGVGADTIVNGASLGGPILAGNAVVIGDAGSVTFGSTGVLSAVTSASSDTAGGADIIKLASKSAVVIGGIGEDSITVVTTGLGLGASTVHVTGDGGAFGYDSAGRLTAAKTIANTKGAKDTISLTVDSNSSMLAFGGEGADGITTTASNRYIVNDFATTTWSKGVMTSKAITGAISSDKLSADGVVTPDTRNASATGSGDFFLAGMAGWGMSRSRGRKGESMSKLLVGRR
jgi:Ca2+-binding RTX toxin-like protein